ncbi:MAG TPA: TIGR03617 family F420-dependent LLM class oxidoreductase [Promineifilum sp.]|nr:TIGR03617 family F420-dependent LLM class oxidoreductase [Promineifilum sp.]HRQ11771.1 TIGR03617 family F420-dependent LLM class oxidoreductase [Promineifilum sp.]
MKFDVSFLQPKLEQIPALAATAEAFGFDGFWVAETNSDPFLNLALAAEHTSKLALGTAIAVTFPRSPAILAYTAWDLQRFSRGRFVLGLGPQVKAHNVLRFGVKWEKPVKKMRETIEAIRAFWDCWQNGTRLDYVGEFYKLALMTPFFDPGPINYPPPPIYIAAVNEQMLRLAGSHCDGVHIHALHSLAYLRDVALPVIESGLARGGKKRSGFSINTAVFVIPTNDPAEARMAEDHVRQQLSFYMSTPSYRPVLAHHGWEAVSDQLGQMARAGEWEAMKRLITDEMLDTFAVIGRWGQLPEIIHARYGDLLDRVSYYLPFEPGINDTGWRNTIDGFKRINRR